MLPRTLALTVAVLLAALPAAQAADSYRQHRLKVTGNGAEVTATLVAPAEWRRVGAPSRTRLRLRAPGTELCTWTFTFTTRVIRSRAATAAEVAEARAPGDGRYVLDSGTRGAGAWRVVRLQAEQVLVGSRIDRVGGERGIWREISGRAQPGADDECHMGTYADFAGPRMGDVLAIAKGRAFVS